MNEPFVTICLAGAPVPKGRPRFRIIQPRGGGAPFGSVYSDQRTRLYEGRLKSAGIEAMAGKEPLDEAVSVSIHAFMEIPASWSKKKRALALAGDIMPTSRTDIDNICKIAADGLNYHPPRFKGDKLKRPIIWHNDSQIVSMQAIKSYSAQPRLEITVYKWAS